MAIRNSHWQAELKEVNGQLMVELRHKGDKDQTIILPADSIIHMTSVVEHIQEEVNKFKALEANQ